MREDKILLEEVDLEEVVEEDSEREEVEECPKKKQSASSEPFSEGVEEWVDLVFFLAAESDFFWSGFALPASAGSWICFSSSAGRFFMLISDICAV